MRMGSGAHRSHAHILSLGSDVRKLFSEILGKITLTIVYTVGHIFIATMCAVIIFSASVNLAAIDAFVEPIINAFWFYFLHSFYGSYSNKREVSYE